MYYLNKTILMIFNPMTAGVLLLAVGWWLVIGFKFQIFGFRLFEKGCRRKAGLWFLMGAMGWFCLWSMGITQRAMGWSFGLDAYHPVCIESLPQADYIVDLGGGMGIDTNVCCYPYISVAADRAWHSARLWKAGKAPIVIPTGIGIADTDAVFLKDLGVPSSAILVENQARNTEENAIYAAALIERHQQSRPTGRQISNPRILLVTSVSHMRRSLMIFKKRASGLECIPAATDYDSVNFFSECSWKDFVPSSGALWWNMVIYKECLGVLGYKMRGF